MPSVSWKRLAARRVRWNKLCRNACSAIEGMEGSRRVRRFETLSEHASSFQGSRKRVHGGPPGHSNNGPHVTSAGGPRRPSRILRPDEPASAPDAAGSPALLEPPPALSAHSRQLNSFNVSMSAPTYAHVARTWHSTREQHTLTGAGQAPLHTELAGIRRPAEPLLPSRSPARVGRWLTCRHLMQRDNHTKRRPFPPPRCCQLTCTYLPFKA